MFTQQHSLAWQGSSDAGLDVGHVPSSKKSQPSTHLRSNLCEGSGVEVKQAPKSQKS